MNKYLLFYKNNMDILRRILVNTINVLYFLIGCGIIFATCILDKNIQENLYKNEVNYPNVIYYVMAIGLVVIIVFGNHFYAMHGKKLFWVVMSIGGITLLIQTIVSFWAPIVNRNDFGHVYRQALRLSMGETFEGIEYFETFANNVNLTILLSWIYQIFGDWKVVIWISALLTNISVMLMTFLVYRLTQNAKISLVMCVIGELLIALAWRAYIPYTDNWGMPFVIGAVAVIFTGLKNRYKFPIAMMIALIGMWIKVTSIIVILSWVIVIILSMEPNRLNRIKGKAITKKILYYCIVIAGIIDIYVFGSSAIWEKYQYNTTEKTLSWEYWFCLGQNNDNTGQVNSVEFGEVWNDYNNRKISIAEKMDYCMEKGVDWIKERGITGNIFFYTKVLDVCFDDGRFHNVHSFEYDTVEHSIIYEFYCKDGMFYRAVSNIYQVLWDFIICNITVVYMVLAVSKKLKSEYIFFEVFILGIIAYLFVFEDRSKYLYMFLPVFVTFSGILLNEICMLWQKSKDN